MISAPITLRGMVIPSSVRRLMNSGRWPALVRIGTLKLATGPSLSFLNEIDLTLSESFGTMERETEGLCELSGAGWTMAYRGSEVDEKRELPWLDVDKAICIGGGADWGDDVWLILDYRANGPEPRIVANDMAEKEGDGSLVWREISPSFPALVESLKAPHGSWEPGRYGGKWAAYYPQLKYRNRVLLRLTNLLRRMLNPK